MVEETAIKDLRARLRGRVITPADAGYDEVRRVHNGIFVRHPALAARCLGKLDPTNFFHLNSNVRPSA